MAIQEREIRGFDRIVWKGVGKLLIEQGEKEGVRIEAADDLLERIVTEVSAGKLTISGKWGLGWLKPSAWKPITIWVSVKDLCELECAGAGQASSSSTFRSQSFAVSLTGVGSVDLTLEVVDLAVKMSGAGSLSLKGKADRQRVTLSGAGSYRARDLASREATVQVSGAGSAEVNAAERLDATLSGVGGVRYMGSPELRDQVSGLGKVSRL